MKNLFLFAILFLSLNSCFKKNDIVIPIDEYNYQQHSGIYTGTVYHTITQFDTITKQFISIKDTVYNVTTFIDYVNNTYFWESIELAKKEWRKAKDTLTASFVNLGFCGVDRQDFSVSFIANSNSIICNKSHILHENNRSDYWIYDLVKQ